MKNLDKIIALGMLIAAIVFNLWLYRLEPTVTTDPNDNTFQFALVDRTNQIWDFASKKCSVNIICFTSYLVDHWVPNWTEGYNLPFYYSHVPQILIVASYRILSSTIQQFSNVTISLFTYYHLLIYLLLSLFPLSLFLALRVIKLPWMIAGIGALLATHLSTDGLYGLDPSSFLWRGYGLSSQLFAMIWLPLAIAYSYRYFSTQHMDGWSFIEQLKIFLGIHRDNSTVKNLHLASRKDTDHGSQYTMQAGSIHEPAGQMTFNSLTGRTFWFAIFFLVATTMGHLGIGMIALLSLVPIAFTKPIIMILHSESFLNIIKATINQATKLLFLLVVTIFFLSYWIIPIFLYDNFHNISFWDPVWKFNSYGWKETLVRLFNGNLFDFGRFPLFTFLVFIGIFAGLQKWLKGTRKTILRSTVSETSLNEDEGNINGAEWVSRVSPKNASSEIPFAGFAFLFLFWLLFYFGRTTWGGLIDLIPGMKEFHLSRFIVGLHIAGIFLAPIGIHAIATWILTTIEQFSNKTIPRGLLYSSIVILLSIGIVSGIYPQTLRYASYNDVLIRKGIEDARLVQKDVDELFLTLRSQGYGGPPGRVFAGRGGGWGKDFKVADTPYYMLLSTYGIPTVLWLPETWSPNADTEQFFSEDKLADYNLYNIRYVIAPLNQSTQPFWKLIKETNTWKLYEVTPTGDAVGGIQRDAQPSSMELSSMKAKERNASIAGEGNRGRTRREVTGYFTSGVRPAIISSDKRSFVNLIHLWIQSSDTHTKGLYPELTFAKDFPRSTGLPNFRMLDEVTYKVPDGSIHNIFVQQPVYFPPGVQSVEQFNDVTIDKYSNITIEKEESEADMIFKSQVTVGKNCVECLVILKQTYHPNWRATIDGKGVQPLTVFPFYLAVPVSEGTHDIVFSYKPSVLKITLLMAELLFIALFIANAIKKFFLTRHVSEK